MRFSSIFRKTDRKFFEGPSIQLFRRPCAPPRSDFVNSMHTVEVMPWLCVSIYRAFYPSPYYKEQEEGGRRGALSAEDAALVKRGQIVIGLMGAFGFFVECIGSAIHFSLPTPSIRDQRHRQSGIYALVGACMHQQTLKPPETQMAFFLISTKTTCSQIGTSNQET